MTVRKPGPGTSQNSADPVADRAEARLGSGASTHQEGAPVEGGKDWHLKQATQESYPRPATKRGFREATVADALLQN